jgi:hypothetical protein
MNLRNISTLLVAGVCFIASSCEEKVNEDILEVPAYSEFGTSNTTGKYFITNSTSSTFKIPVGITNVSSTDRTIQFTLASSTGAVAGTQYTAPTSVVIPAGKALDSLVIHGIFAGYPTGRRDTLRISITGGDAPVNTYNNVYTLIMQKYCDVTFPSFAGDFDNTLEYEVVPGPVSWGPYTTSVSNIVSTGPTSATAVLENLFDYGGQVNAVIDWADPANFKVTIAEQNTGALVSSGSSTYRLWIRTSSAGVSTFSSCDGTITVTIDAIAKNAAGTTLGTFATDYRIVMAR